MLINRVWFLIGLILVLLSVLVYNSTRELYVMADKGYKSLRWSELVKESQVKQASRKWSGIESLEVLRSKVKLQTKGNDYYVIERPPDSVVSIREGELNLSRVSFPSKFELDLTYSRQFNFGLGIRLVSFDWLSFGLGLSSNNLYAKVQYFVLQNTKVCMTWGPEFSGSGNRIGIGLSVDL